MKAIDLRKISPDAPAHVNKETIKQETAQLLQQISDLQNLLYASKQHAVLVVIQGMDASGKDSKLASRICYI
ncbi:polyphosphate kinase 2 family protein [Deminuibacter soli]|uniref:Polyphosphate kinase-2-related domain-containing protein n=1 Tax=Deminuibacter soli TaxID=2291815 RepID=A0A3E1NPK4_9BACT|nr:hypothetical protein [Deminuibacter soli]RFM29718.1 hypothetical protein DXN05_01695 [Deminuibacter soli]